MNVFSVDMKSQLRASLCKYNDRMLKIKVQHEFAATDASKVWCLHPCTRVL